MSLFPEWQEEHKDDPKLLPERIRAMLNKFGKCPGKTCRKCAHLLRQGERRIYLKCEFTKITHGPGTDWKAGWPACGKFEESKDDNDLRD